MTAPHVHQDFGGLVPMTDDESTFGAWPHIDAGPCPNGVCTQFHCLCDTDPDVVRHGLAVTLGMHGRAAYNPTMCACGIAYANCPAVRLFERIGMIQQRRRLIERTDPGARPRPRPYPVGDAPTAPARRQPTRHAHSA